MSVKGKVKRLNKEIADLKQEIRRLKLYGYMPIKDVENMYKDNFIKLILNERKPIEHNHCRFTISIGQLDTMKNARLEVTKTYNYGGGEINFDLSI